MLFTSKKIDCADFLVQFGLLYRDTLQLSLTSEKSDFLNNKLKDICFSTLNTYNFGKANTELNLNVKIYLFKNLTKAAL